MQVTATTKYAEALANDIAEALSAAPHATGRVAAYYDKAAETWAVRVTVAHSRYDLLMPFVGAQYSLFRNNRWIGGMNLNADATPIDVALALLDRIGQTIR